MIDLVTGKLTEKRLDSVVVTVGGFGLRIYTSLESMNQMGAVDNEVTLHCYLYVREDKLELYGFTKERERTLFCLLIGVSGIGPKTALGMLSISSVGQIEAAITSGKSELLTKTPGIGKKTAERVVLELKNKIVSQDDAAVARVEVDIQVEEALTALGYSRQQARQALKHVDSSITGVEKRLREALQILSSNL